MLLASSKLSLNFSEMRSNSLFVILTNEVDKAVNFVKVGVQIVEAVLEV